MEIFTSAVLYISSRKIFSSSRKARKPEPRPLPTTVPDGQPRFKLINKKAMVASKEELEVNHRAHSAKLRIIEREFENET